MSMSSPVVGSFSPAITPSSSITSLPPFTTTSTPRLQALYSDFSRQKQSNPTSYHANVDWWRNALEVFVGSGLQHLGHLTAQAATPQRRPRNMKEGNEEGERDVFKSDRLVLHARRELMERVKLPKVGKPLALGAVLSELRTTRIAVLLPEFLSSKTSIYDSGWLPARIVSYVVGKPLWWALEQMGIVGDDGLLGGSHRGHHHKDTSWWGDYVLIHLVEAAADEVLERQEELQVNAGDSLYTLDSFRATFSGVGAAGTSEALRETDAQVLIKYLERDRGALVVDKGIIKFIDKQAPAEDRSITAVDSGILELKSATRNLHAQVDALHSKIDDCTWKATASLQQKRKPAALNYLRSRKLLEEQLNKCLGSLSTLESTLLTVEAAASDIKIMKSYESSTAILRAILAHPSLERSSIDKTMEALAEANADAKEVDDAVRLGGDVALGVEDIVDDAELEEEWKAMVKEMEVENKVKDSQADVQKMLNKVGNAPIDTPTVEPSPQASRILIPS